MVSGTADPRQASRYVTAMASASQRSVAILFEKGAWWCSPILPADVTGDVPAQKFSAMEPMDPMGRCTFCAESRHTSPHELPTTLATLATARSPTSRWSSVRNSMNASPRRTEPTPHKMAQPPARCRRHPSAPSRWLSAATPPERMPETPHPEGVDRKSVV